MTIIKSYVTFFNTEICTKNKVFRRLIYGWVYDNIVDYCVKAIGNGDYNKAYTRYKSSILSLEETIVRKPLQERLVKTLRIATVKLI